MDNIAPAVLLTVSAILKDALKDALPETHRMRRIQYHHSYRALHVEHIVHHTSPSNLVLGAPEVCGLKLVPK